MPPTIAVVPQRAAASPLRQSTPLAAPAALRAPIGAVVAIAAAPFRGFGYVQYLPVAGVPGLQLPAGKPVAITMAADPGQTLDSLAGPFAGWSFWDGADIRARAVGDAYDVRLTLSVIGSVAGGDVFCAATVNGASSAIETDQSSLIAAPGTPQTLSFRLALYPKSSFVAVGARIYLTPTVPVTIINEKLIIAPTTAGPVP